MIDKLYRYSVAFKSLAEEDLQLQQENPKPPKELTIQSILEYLKNFELITHSGNINPFYANDTKDIRTAAKLYEDNPNTDNLNILIKTLDTTSSKIRGRGGRVKFYRGPNRGPNRGHKPLKSVYDDIGDNLYLMSHMLDKLTQ